MRKIVAWGNFGRRLADALAGDETIWITDRVDLSKSEKSDYKIISTNIAPVYAYRELRSSLHGCDSVCLLGALHSKIALVALDMIAKVLEENRIERCNAFVVKPFSFEGEENAKRAEEAEMRLLKFCFHPMIYDNEKLLVRTDLGEVLSLVEKLDKVFEIVEGKCNFYHCNKG